ncbi:MAG TPA: RluA family pseudouridine synthase [Ktedonobacterales bacterium]|nr:RluA family pseudouridine synthase [Ktedonobacterales bacterium]
MPGTTHLQVTGISILYEDTDLLVVDKPAGLVIHPAYKHPDGTLFDAVRDELNRRGEAKPCLLHRLDKDTSGAVLLAKTERARRHLVRQIEQRALRKTYLALVCGRPEPASGSIDVPLCRDPNDRLRVHIDSAGDQARTDYQTLKTWGGRCSLVELHPITGRMHQLRVHLAALGTPIVGDTRYADQARWEPLAPARQMLHAQALTFQHPTSGDNLTVQAPLPGDLRTLLAADCLTQEALAGEPIFAKVSTLFHFL